MLLSKTYSYINTNGDRELTSHKMSPSTLKRANVPVELVKKYTEANNALQVMAGSIHSDNQHSEEIQHLQDKKFDAVREIESFLAEQEMISFGKIDISAVHRLLNSDISAYKIEKDTGVSRMTLTNIKNGKADLLKLQLRNAVLLSNYALSREL